MIKLYIKIGIAFFIIGLLTSCRASKKIESAIKKQELPRTPSIQIPDTVKKIDQESIRLKNDSLQIIKTSYQGLTKNNIVYKTFSSKIDVAYTGPDKKKYNLNVVLRMQYDSTIWISINSFLGEAARLLITKDSVKLLKKFNENVYLARSINYLQELTMLPLNLTILQNLLIGNPVFIDSNIVSYKKYAASNMISLLHYGLFFKTFITLAEPNYLIENIKLDDVDEFRSRTCNVYYTAYERNSGVYFSTKRHITVTEKNKLEIDMNFKSYNFNEPQSFPFNVPKNYKIEY